MISQSRGTKEIITPLGHTLYIYTYLTAGEARDLQTPYLKEASEFPSDVIAAKGAKAAVFQAVQDLTLRTIIASFDGKEDGKGDFDLVTTLMNLPNSEFKFIFAAINAIINPDTEEKKTN